MPTIELDSVTLYYDQKGQGPAILLLHGLGSCGQDWLFQTPELSKHYEVHTPDFRGHGRSEKKGPYTVLQCVEDMRSYIEKQAIGPVHIVGLSFGSFVALQLALKYPHLVKSLVLTGTTSRIKDIGFWPLFLRGALLYICPMNTVAHFVSKTLFPDPEQVALYTRCRLRIASCQKAIYTAYCHDLVHFDVTDGLKSLTSPLTIIVGQNDQLLPRFHAEKIKQAIPSAHLVVLKGARHAAPLDSPELFNHQLLLRIKNNQ